MKSHLRWWGFYALVPLMIGLMLLDRAVSMSRAERNFTLVGIALLICILADIWIRSHWRLIADEASHSRLNYRFVAGGDTETLASHVRATGTPIKRVSDSRAGFDSRRLDGDGTWER